MGAAEAEQCGLVTRMVPPSQLPEEMRQIQHLADHSPSEALTAAKNLVRADMRPHLHQVRIVNVYSVCVLALRRAPIVLFVMLR